MMTKRSRSGYVGLAMAAAAWTLLTPPAAEAAMETVTVTGSLQGFNCAAHGLPCPEDRLDPHLALEPDFVIVREDGTYLLMPNIDRVIKARHVLKDVRATGTVAPRHGSIDVERLDVKDGDGYRTIWSKQMAMEEIRRREAWFGPSGG